MNTAFCLSLLIFAQQQADTNQELDKTFRRLIPQATAIDTKTFERIARSPTAPTPDDFKEKSLSVVLFSLKVDELKPDSEQFQFLTERYPRAKDLAEEMYHSIGGGNFRVVIAPVTMIHANRIKNLKVKVDGGKAEGSFEFLVPKLYKGKADFSAKQSKDKAGKPNWTITEFRMPEYKIVVRRDKSGKWERVESMKK